MPDPCTQEETINDIDQTIHTLEQRTATQAGWFKTSAWVIGVAVVVIGGLSGVILGKLSAIEALLTSSQVVQGRLEERYLALDKRMESLEKKHDYIDQMLNPRNGNK